MRTATTMTSPRLVAMLDQASAADGETASLLARLAHAATEAGETPNYAEAGEVHHRLHVKMCAALLANVLAGHPGLCPHLDMRRPEPVFWLAWASGKLRCAACSDRATRRIIGTKEDRVCDSCRRFRRRGLYWGTFHLPSVVVGEDSPICVHPAIVHFGLCSRCLGTPNRVS